MCRGGRKSLNFKPRSNKEIDMYNAMEMTRNELIEMLGQQDPRLDDSIQQYYDPKNFELIMTDIENFNKTEYANTPVKELLEADKVQLASIQMTKSIYRELENFKTLDISIKEAYLNHFSEDIIQETRMLMDWCDPDNMTEERAELILSEMEYLREVGILDKQ